MRLRLQIVSGALLVFMGGAIAQPQQRGAAGRGNPNATFPAQQRPPGDPALIARGNTLYSVNCRLCHGADLRGGDQGGPNLLRSAVVFGDQAGELIGPVVQNGRNNDGMPPMPKFTLPADDIKAIAEYIHSIVAASQGQGAPPRGAPITLDVLVGNAAAGQAYFTKVCSTCHSVSGDLKGIGARNLSPMQLQDGWLRGNAGTGGRGGPAKPIAVTVTPPSGPKVEGTLTNMNNDLNDFLVVVTLPDGTSRSFRRDGDVPKVEVRDPRDAHRKLLPSYTDKDIHDVTAYLVTVK